MLSLVLVACSSAPLKIDSPKTLEKNAEFEQSVKIAAAPVKEPVVKKENEPIPIESNQKFKKTKKPQFVGKSNVLKKEQKNIQTGKKAVVQSEVRQPDLEDNEGFLPGSRRPIQDPFRVGEEVVHSVNYFKVSAGELRLKVEPFVTVNNRKSYTFAIEIQTSKLFSSFYSVQDRVETFVDYEDLVPRVFQLHVKESGQLREAKMLFDTDNNTATFWEKKVTKAHGEEEKKQNWEILPFTQNVHSAIFYMRNFKWEVGKQYSFRVGNDKENLVFSGVALRKEVLDTKLGPMNAIVVQPNIVLKGKFKPIGDNFIWLSDDDRKLVLRIESKIKIGTLVSEVVSINPGR